MDHLCPRLSFPLAPCMSCLSGSPPAMPTHAKTTKRSNFIQSMVFPVPPKSPRTSSKITTRVKQTSKRSHRPKLSIQTRLPTIPQKNVMDELSTSLANFVIQQNEASQRQSHMPSVRSMRKDSATVPWLEPIEQVRTNT